MTELGVHERGRNTGVPLVLLHAFPFDHRMFNALSKRLTDRRVISLDAPEFGDSSSFRRVADSVRGPIYGLETYADAIAAFAKEREFSKIVVGGVSMGGYTAMALAERHPELLAGIALIDTKSTADDDVAAENRRTMAEEIKHGIAKGLRKMPSSVLADVTLKQREKVHNKVIKWIGQAPFDGIAWAQLSMAARPDRTEVLRGLSIPAAVIRGDDDKLSSLAEHERMAKALRCEVTTIENAGHLSPLEQPDAVAEVLSDLLDRADND